MLQKSSKKSVNSFSGVVGGLAGGVIGGVVVLASGASLQQATLGSIATGIGTFVPIVWAKKDRENLEKIIKEQEKALTFSKDLVVLEGREQSLLNNINELKSQRNNLEETIKLIEIEKPDLQILAQRQSESSALKTEINELQGQLETIKQQIQQREREKNDLGIISEELAQKQGELKVINQRLERLIKDSKDLESRKRESEGLKAQIEILQPELDSLKQEITAKENRLEVLRKTLGELSEKQGELNVINERLETLIQESKDLESRKRESEGLKTQIEILQPELYNLKQEISVKENKLEILQETLGELSERQGELNVINERLEILYQEASQLESRQRESEGLQAQIEILQPELDSLKQEISVRENRLEILRKTLGELSEKQGELNVINERLERLHREATELELFRNTYDVLTKEYSEIETRKNNLALEIPRLEAEKNRLLQVIQESEGNAIIAENLRREIEELSAQITTLQREKRSLKREIERLDSERANLEDEIARNQNKIDLQEKKLGQIQEEIQQEIELKEARLRQIQEDIRQEVELKEIKLKEIEDKIRIAKEEFEGIENSTKQALKSLQIPIEIKAKRVKNFASEADFLTQFNNYLSAKGLTFPDRIIKAFHTSLKVQDISALVILAGISGTGKSELPQAYSEFIGAPLVMLPVQPRWDSPQDLQGFYNYIEKKYKPTELMHYLYQHQHDKNFNGRMVLVLLDEMNLARVEYYFSDFLSKLETRRNKSTYLDIEVGSIKLPENERRVIIPEEFLFVGTMNEDETTQSLSDKVLDRANVLTFGQPTELKLRGDKKANPPIPTEYLSWNDFKGWMNEPIQGNTDRVKYYIDRANTIMEQLGRPFAHRVYQSIAKYVANYPNANNDQSIMKSAIADQFGQKLLPKLRGIMVDDSNVKPHLDSLKSLINELQDEPLNRAFDKACEGQYGQFQWKGMVY
ncbi:AAA family ATPase [Geminocystis sp. CENA526]|uniref:AAA family ATPase n=1 Tax=Geminocystis sp. CENA526 TaxID=1355871 RepID=UPI003D6EB0E7